MSDGAMQRLEIAHSVVLRSLPGGVELSDTPELGYHLAKIVDERFEYARLHIRVVASPAETCDTNLHFHHWGAIKLASIGMDGVVLPGAIEPDIAVTMAGTRITIELSYICTEPVFFLGVSDAAGSAAYAGTGQPQWLIHSLEVTAQSIEVSATPRIVVVDVGAAGGLEAKWRQLLPQLEWVLIEPDPEAATSLRAKLRNYPSATVIEAGLAGRDGIRTLNVTRFPECSSLLEPDFAELQRYAVAPCSDVMRKIPVECRRYDTIDGARAPDLVKIDVQGAEYEVLEGFGAYLDTVLAIELESHFYPIYEGQRLLADLISLLSGHGLRMRRLAPQHNFDRDLVEVNAFFSRETELSPVQQDKLDLLHRMLDMPMHPGGHDLTRRYAPGLP
jgi:FkbM family methyltransferase